MSACVRQHAVVLPCWRCLLTGCACAVWRGGAAGRTRKGRTAMGTAAAAAAVVVMRAATAVRSIISSRRRRPSDP